MQLEGPLYRGRLIKRYKRFLADIALETGEIVTAHCANPGAMTGIAVPGSLVFVAPSLPGRKLAYRWVLVACDGTLVGIDTTRPNHLVREALTDGRIAELAAYRSWRTEVPYGSRSRVDFLGEGPGLPPCYVEVKNVHLVRTPGLAEFPDCVTARGAKHLVDLADRVAAGDRALLLFVVQRSDCSAVRVAQDLDPAYAAAMGAARARGIGVACYGCTLTHDAISLDRPLPFLPD